MALSSTGRLTIDLGAVRANYQTLKDRVGDKCTVAAVVKADGYGLGADRVASVLLSEGCTNFFVSSPAEGAALRPHVQDAKIYILNGFYDTHAESYLEHNLIPVIDNLKEIERYKTIGKGQDKDLPAALDFDTGMNRLGFGVEGANHLLAHPDMLEGLEVDTVMSHFASADEPDNPLNREQYETFKKITAHFPQAQKSLANSFGVFLNPEYHFDMVRPGMAMYGLNPTPLQANPMSPVASLKVPIIRLRDVKAGETIGYNETHTFDQDTCVATVAAGYADGLLRALSNKGKFYWKSYPCPIRGRISMDLITTDLSKIPENERPKPGDFLEVLGTHQTADDFANDAGTIGYEVLTSLGERYKRQYIN